MNIANIDIDIDIDIDIIFILLYVVDSIERSLCTSSMMMTITLPCQWHSGSDWVWLPVRVVVGEERLSLKRRARFEL